MFKKLLLIAALLASSPAWAQNIQCPNRPLGDSTNACANTRFVINNASGGIPGGSTGQVQYNNAGAFGGITGATTNGTALTLTAPVLGTPASGTLTNTTGFPVANLAGAGTGVLTALGINIGSAGAPVLFNGALGTPSSGTGTNLTGVPISSGISGLGTGNATALAINVGTTGSFARLIASGAKALATGAISSATCTSAQTDTATGTATTDVVTASFNGDPTAVTGYVPLTTGMLVIIPYPTTDTVNFKVCNNTGSSITPGAITINWRVLR